MITRLQAKNFKSWQDTGSLQVAPLTGFFGSNSSGKTSILQILLLLKQTVESPDRKRVLHTGDDRSLVDLGTFFDLVHQHESNATLQTSLSWNLPDSLVINDPEKESDALFRIDALSFASETRVESDRVIVESFAYEFGKHKFGMRRKIGEEVKEINRYEYELITDGYHAKRFRGRGWPLPPPVKCYGFPDEATAYYQNTGFLSDFVLSFEAMFSRTTYLGPLREYPRRNYVWAGERPQDVGRRGEQAVAALLAGRAEGLRSGRRFGRGGRAELLEECIAAWMRELGLIHSFQLKAIAPNRKDYEVRVKKTKNSSEVLITDVGFGVSQILPVLVLCYYAPQGSTIILEQPEIHLHPYVQAGLADILIDVVMNRGVQVIVESHSEHLLRRLQRRIAEEVIPPEKTALYFCRMDNGKSTIERLDVDLLGAIRNWPQGFFGDEMEELSAMTEAAMEPQGRHANGNGSDR